MIKFTQDRGPWSYSDSGTFHRHWSSDQGSYGIWEMPTSHRGDTPPDYWLGIINDPTGEDRMTGVTWLPDSPTFQSAVELARQHFSDAQ
ncbi:MAG: hypothetical protein A4E20_10775 [Nitrospira sp. SG-bin2]|uniref:hypothetical protein n=1 Tax=Nitrospira cf. moscoviensis SBR1015 TaxID=96242 RepID=UPI000A0E11A0|nr:hypothetical protein [Nitrospira cf. moscoviensis SBR1015]OQW34495.1 MAG: hypothetical protein A4E20_10775 [Nitrospira sp. SG-bin2]